MVKENPERFKYTNIKIVSKSLDHEATRVFVLR